MKKAKTRKLLLLISILPAMLLAGCSEEEEQFPEVINSTITKKLGSVLAQDSLHAYEMCCTLDSVGGVKDYFLSKYVRSTNDTIWQVKIDLPDSELVNIGYGEQVMYDDWIASWEQLIDVEDFVALPVIGTNEWYYPPTTHVVYCYVYSNQSGNLINRVRTTFPDLYAGFIRWNNGELLILKELDEGLQYGDNLNGFIRLNSKGAAVEETTGNANLHPCKNPIILSETEYLCYENSAGIYNLYKGIDEGYPKSIDLHIKEMFPNEKYTPACIIKSASFIDGVIHFFVDIIFYDGHKEEHEILIDYSNLE